MPTKPDDIDEISALLQPRRDPNLRTNKPINLPICPHCGHDQSRITGTTPQAFDPFRPGITARYHQCRRCRKRFWSYTNAAGKHTVATEAYQTSLKRIRALAERKQSDPEIT